jgi:kumamolisin
MHNFNLQTIVCVSLLLLVVSFAHAATPDSLVRLPGHVLPALAKAKPIETPSTALAEEPLTLTVVLKRDDQAGFDEYLRDVYDPKSPSYRKFLTQREIADRFGPSREVYDNVLRYLQNHGFTLVEGSANRLTLMVRGTRTAAEHAFALHFGDYEISGRRFFANTDDPALPEDIAVHVASISGLSNLATPRPAKTIHLAIIRAVCRVTALFDLSLIASSAPPPSVPAPNEPPPASTVSPDEAYRRAYLKCVNSNKAAAGYGKHDAKDPPPPAWQGADGTGQTVGLTAFDTFHMSDVQDYIDFMGFPAGQINRVSQVHVNGGAGPSPGPDQDEVLLDIAAVMAIAPGAEIVVYDGPFTGAFTSFQPIFNAMINDGVNIISNSWAYCEDQTTLADVQSIDTILQAAAASGISVFNASGDTGSTCLDGSPNTAAVPASSPNATAVGGTSLKPGPGFTYESETWWDGNNDTPPTGEGGFGLSRFFSRPGYQNGLHTNAMRSVPDVVADADPANGVVICAKDLGGCPTGLFYGGTSSAAPTWAAFTALLNQTQGFNLGFLNPLMYPLANTEAFYNAASLGSDFTHVGLGSPNLARLHQRLTAQTPGAVNPSVSLAQSVGPGNAVLPTDTGVAPLVPADGTTEAHIVIRLADANGNPVGGKNVTLTPSPAGSAIISPPVGVSRASDGVVTFTITDTSPNLLTFTVTDTTDGIVLAQTPSLRFIVPPATSAGITASPTNVTADGVATTTITVTLRDALNRPTPGKLITLSQGSGHSMISGPNPSVTDSNGQIQFTATNVVNETVMYTAVDVTDGDLPVPGSAIVTFSAGTGPGCNLGVGTGVAGFTSTSFATGFETLNIGNGVCTGPFGLAFDSTGHLFVMNPPDGSLYRFLLDGGVASEGTQVSTTPLPLLPNCPVDIAFSKDGAHLFLAQQFCIGTGNVVEISPIDGQILRTIASNVACTTGLAIDPVSGDLFVSQPCAGNGSPNILRISNPASATPSAPTVYSSPGRTLGLTFSADGTLWAVSLDSASGTYQLTRINGTNTANPGQFAYLATLPTLPGTPNATDPASIVVAGNPANPGNPPFVLVNNTYGTITKVDLTVNPPVTTDVVTGGSRGFDFVAGPDGCAYATQSDRILRISKADGSCFGATDPLPGLSLDPPTVAPSPAQGTAQTFTATFHHVNVPVDTPVFFTVMGANPHVKLVRTDANGQAAFSYTAINEGRDMIVATATVNTTTLTSNKAGVTWAAGKHVTFLTLNPSPTAGTPGVPITVIASVTDSSVDPTAPVVGVAVTFTLGSAQCVGTTDSNGIASCTLTPSVTGMSTLAASFAGDAQFVTSSDTIGFNVLAAPPSCVPATEVCDGQDNDCDGQIDDGLGTVSCGVGTCARTVNACVNGVLQTCTPGTPSAEVCDGLDNSCNGQIDDGLGTLSCGVGACARTVNACVNGSSQTCTPGIPTAEVCGDGIDNNCNGQTDESCPSVDTCLSTTVLDTFNRANGSVGSNWRGATGTSFYRIAGNRLDVQLGGPLYWNPTAFGTNQAAFVTLSTIDAKSPSQGVLLKVQDGSVPSAGTIAVVYDALAKGVRVSTIRLGAPAWTPYGNTAVSFTNGDKLGACAKANGEVRVYKNDAVVKTVTLNTTDQRFFNAKGGKVGVWTLLAPHAFLDNFGGATVAP